MIAFKRTQLISTLFSLVFMVTLQTTLFAQSAPLTQQEPWTATQLVAPADLARTIETGAREQQPLLLSVGPAAMIKGSIDIGPASDKEGLNKLKAALEKQPKDKEIIIYCGCCPFAHCPNIRPAFRLLKEMHYTHARLLNLEHNIRTDWMDKGYPSEN